MKTLTKKNLVIAIGFTMGNFEKARPAFPNDEITTAVCLKPKDLPNPETAQGLEACLWFTLAMEESMQAPLRKMDFYKKAEALAPNSSGILATKLDQWSN